MSAATTTWQAWNELKAADLAGRMAMLRALRAQIDAVLDVGQDYFETREWTALQAQLRKVAPAFAGAQLLQQLQKAEQFIAGFEDDESQDGIEALLEGVRAAIAAGTMQSHDVALAVLA